MPGKRNNRPNRRQRRAPVHRIFTNTVRTDITIPSGYNMCLAQLQWSGALSDADGTNQAYRMPKLLSKVNPTNLKITTRSPFQKRPLDSESTTAVLNINISPFDKRGDISRSLSLKQMLDLDSRQVIVESVGVQLIPGDQTAILDNQQVYLIVTTKAILLPQTDIALIQP